MASTDSYWFIIVWLYRPRFPSRIGMLRWQHFCYWRCHKIENISNELKDMESYIMELIPTLPQLEGLERSFHSFYVCTAVRKFFFFLDPLRTGKIRIRDILSCSFLDDLLEVSRRYTLLLWNQADASHENQTAQLVQEKSKSVLLIHVRTVSLETTSKVEIF